MGEPRIPPALVISCERLSPVRFAMPKSQTLTMILRSPEGGGRVDPALRSPEGGGRVDPALRSTLGAMWLAFGRHDAGLTSRGVWRKRFAGLMSRCTMPTACAAASPRAA